MAQSQVAPPTTPYGAPISFEAAKRAASAAEAEAVKNNWAVAIAVVDSGGNLVILDRLDNTQLSSGRIAEDKARTSVEFRRPTKALEDALAGGGAGLRTLTFGACVAALVGPRTSWLRLAEPLYLRSKAGEKLAEASVSE